MFLFLNAAKFCHKYGFSKYRINYGSISMGSFYGDYVLHKYTKIRINYTGRPMLRINLFLLLFTFNSFANAAALKCPTSNAVNPDGNGKWFLYYAFSEDGRKLVGTERYSTHPCCYIFINYTVDSNNVELSKVDEQTKELTCAYNIHVTGATTGYDEGYVAGLLKSEKARK